MEAAADEAMDTGIENATNQNKIDRTDNEFDDYDDAFEEFVSQEEDFLLATFAEYHQGNATTD